MTAQAPDKLQQNVVLAPYTWMRVGGPAKYFVQARSSDEIVHAVRWAKEKEIPFVVLGGGSNVLVSDNGFAGLVIRASADNAVFDGTTVIASSGIVFTRLATLAGSHGLSGMEFAVGIPGTLGGAIRGNAGAFGGETKDVVQTVRVLDENGDIEERPPDALDFRYRHSVFKTNYEIILGAKLSLAPGDPTAIKALVQKRLDYRRTHQPLSMPSLGSTFKNVPLTALSEPDLDDRYRFSSTATNGFVGAGYIIEQLGLKGTTIGGAQISEKHANFIVNLGTAKAEHVVILMGIVQQKVRTALHGLHLEPEIQLLGFS